MKKYLLLVLGIVISISTSFSALSVGDIAFVQYNADGTDDFAFITLVDIPAGEVIKFTDNEENDLGGGEGTITWTAPSGGVSCGTIITIQNTPSATTGTVTESNSLNFAGSGDGIIVYQGTTGSPTFITALGNDGSSGGIYSGSKEGNLPSGLTLGTDAQSIVEIDNAKYNGSTLTGSKSAILSAIYDFNNWVGHNSTNQTFSGTFNVTSCSATPTITTTPSTLTGFTYIEGSGPSAEQTFTIAGSNLTNNIIVTPPINWEISLTTGGSFSATNPITLTQSGGTVSSTTIYTRMVSSLLNTNSPFSGNITCTSTGATQQDVAVDGTVTVACTEPNLATAISFANITSSAIDVSWTASTGGADSYLVIKSTSSSLSSNPADASTYAINDALGGGTVVFNGSAISFTDAGLIANTQYYYYVFAYNDVACGGGPNYTASSLDGNATTLNGPCLSDNFNSNYGNWTNGSGTYRNSGAGRTGSGVGFNTNGDDIYLGSIISNPASLEFYLARSSSTANKTIRVEYSTDAITWTVAQSILVSSVTQTFQLFTINLNLTGDYYLRFNMSQRTGGTYYLDDVDVFCSALGPEIGIQGNSTEIIDGDISPDVSDDTDFGSVEAGVSSVVKTFTILNTGGADLTVSSLASSDTEFAIGGITTPVTITAGNQTTFTVTFSSAILGSYTSTITVNNDDTDEGTYTFVVAGEATNSNTSDIIVNSSFVYQSNIDYTAYQQASNFTATTGANIGVFKFDIRDGGTSSPDGDFDETELTDITFTLANTLHSSFIRNAALFNGNTMVSNVATINNVNGTISFSGFSYTVLDDDIGSLTLRVSFNTTVTDNEQLQFTITSATANSNGSVFGSANAGGAVSSIVSDRNRLEVTATDLLFNQQPSNATTNQAMAPAVTINAVDSNLNIDLDWAGTVTITSTGTLSAAQYEVASNGTATFSNIIHSTSGTGWVLTASSTLIADNSNTFDIIDFTFYAGDYKTTRDYTSFSLNNTTGMTNNWEYFDGTSWGATPGDYAPQNASTVPNRIIIDHLDVNAAGNSLNSYNEIIVRSGGELVITDDNNANPLPADFIGANDTLEVLNGGKIIIQGDIALHSSAYLIVRAGAEMIIDQASMNNVHQMWDGHELFEGNSLFEINNWDWTASPQVRSLINISTAIDNNANGYKFGKVYINPSSPIGDNWTIVGGPINVNVSENKFEVNNQSSSFYVAVMSNKTSGISATFGDTLLISDGEFTFGSSYSSDDFDQTITVKGDFIVYNDDNVLMHKNGNNTPTSVAAGQVKIEGNIEVWNLTTAFTSDVNDKELILTNDKNHTIEIAPNCSNFPMIVEVGDSAILKVENLKFAGNSSIEIEDGATFNFGFDGTTALEVQNISGGNNKFLQRGGAYLLITHPQGIWDASANGNVQSFSASNTTYSQAHSTYHYTGKGNQETGDAFTTGSTAKTMICDLETNTNTLTVTEKTGTSVILDIRKGIVVNTDAAYIDGSGDLTIDDGGLRTSVLTATENPVPALSGTYILNAGFIELNASGDQTLRGARDYYDLIISGSNTSGSDDKTPTSAFTVANNLKITGTPIFDILNNGMTGNAGITMDGGLLRISKLGSTPELLGSATPYNLSGGTMEWYGTNTSQNQNIRGTFNGGTTINYFNIEVNALAANVDNYNVGIVASIEVSGTMNINSPAVFQTDEADHILGTGVFNVKAGSTYKYGDEFGITLGNSTAVSAGAIRVSSNRTAINFSSDASYGWVSNGDMVTGDGLPASCVNAYTQKTTSTDNITLTNALEVTNSLNLTDGIIQSTSTELLSLRDNATVTGASDNSFVDGPCRKIGDDAFVFPIGDGTNYQAAEISAPANAGDHFTAQYFQADPHPAYNENSKDGTIDHISSCEYWTVDRTNGTSDVDVSLTWDANSCGVSNLSELLVVRWDGTSWKDHGNGGTTGTSSAGTVVTSSAVTSFSPFTLASTTSANPLPVELLYFNAEPKENTVLTSWSTATEINNDFFTVERSENGIDFKETGTVKGAGNSTNKTDYSFIDENPFSGISYYRLKQTDFDGTFEYSNIIAVLFNAINLEVENIYPNPVQDELYIPLSLLADSKVFIKIIDFTGRIIENKTFTSLENGTLLKIKTNNLVAGSYWISIETSTNKFSKSFVKK